MKRKRIKKQKRKKRKKELVKLFDNQNLYIVCKIYFFFFNFHINKALKVVSVFGFFCLPSEVLYFFSFSFFSPAKTK